MCQEFAPNVFVYDESSVSSAKSAPWFEGINTFRWILMQSQTMAIASPYE